MCHFALIHTSKFVIFVMILIPHPLGKVRREGIYIPQRQNGGQPGAKKKCHQQECAHCIQIPIDPLLRIWILLTNRTRIDDAIMAQLNAFAQHCNVVSSYQCSLENTDMGLNTQNLNSVLKNK